ncbi:RNA-directed DNA polymerase, eukaryota, reverse transcriptase zinc-binding domain protein [Tanacetum coccineum]
MDAGMFKGIMLDSSMQLSHMFYVDDAIFVGQWSEMNMNTIVYVLDCFYRALGLLINMSKSKIMGIVVDEHKVEQAAEKFRCSILKAPFFYLGTYEGSSSYGVYSGSFFNGIGLGSKKSIWVKWKNIWRFMTHKSSLWARVIMAIHGNDGNIGKSLKCGHMSIWHDIVQEMETLKAQDNVAFKYKYPRLYALEVDKNLLLNIEGVSLVPMNDKWVWSLEGSGDFFVASVRKLIDDRRLPDVSSKTRWIKAVPIKVNVLAWKVRLDCLPTRLNISYKGIDIDSILFPICGNAVESSRHLFFKCQDVKEIFCKICRWWDVSYREMASYED